jgi:hypothetical protein
MGINMKKVLSIVVLVLLQISSFAVTVETTYNLNVYYPEYSKIDLVCGQMPKVAKKNVEFCCEASFTGELLNGFKHSNIADDHICNGVMKKGYRCKTNTGGFVWGKGIWKFIRKADFPAEANGWNMGFCQLLIIKDGVAMPIEAKMQNSKTVYRALCEKDGKLCIVESKKVVTYESFVTFLKAFKVTHALYLDMGSGWNYAWYRDKDGQVIERFPESKKSPNYKYRTNWITFYK